MATTVEEVARSALAAVACDAALPLAGQWVYERITELASGGRLRAYRRLLETTVAAPITAGTVTVAQGGKLVTGDATAAAAWSEAIVGRFFQGAIVWHEIVGVSGTVLTLAEPYTEAALAASSYRIVQRYLALDADVRQVQAAVHPRRRWPLAASGRRIRRSLMRSFCPTAPTPPS